MNRIKKNNYIKATDLNRGKASGCIKQVHDSGESVIILKNSEPYAVIVPLDFYNAYYDLLKLVENYKKELEVK